MSLVNLSTAARLLGITRQAVQDAIDRGALEAVIVKVPTRFLKRGDVVKYGCRTKRRISPQPPE